MKRIKLPTFDIIAVGKTEEEKLESLMLAEFLCVMMGYNKKPGYTFNFEDATELTAWGHSLDVDYFSGSSQRRYPIVKAKLENIERYVFYNKS